MILYDPKTREEWLACRKHGIGGSEAGCITGANPYKTARTLWREKAGITRPADAGDKPAVRFGKEAEPHIRVLFCLMHPEYACEYHEFRMHANDRKPYIFATLDGELIHTSGRRGILEIKTTTIRSASQWEEWDGRLPQHYYVQVLHQLLACGWADYAIVYAFIRYATKDGEERAALREYRIGREEVQDDLRALEQEETAFWQSLRDGEEPPDILPDI